MKPLLDQLEKPYSIFAITVLAYGSALLFQLGIGQFYDLGLENAFVDITNLAIAVIVALFVISLLFAAQNFKQWVTRRFKVFRSRKDNAAYVSTAVDTFILTIAVTGILVGLFQLFPQPAAEQEYAKFANWLVEWIVVLLPLLVPVIIIQDVIRAKLKKQKFHQYLKTRNQRNGVKKDTESEKLWAFVLIGVLLYLPSSLLGGYLAAHQREDYFTIAETDKTATVIVSQKGDSVVLKTYNKESKVFEPGFNTRAFNDNLTIKPFTIERRK